MDFGYDHGKSKANREKHGISLEEAKQLWVVPGVEVEARSADEPRFLRIGKLEGKFYSCVYTIREGVIRLISVRRSRREEEEIYYKKIKDDKRLEDEETTEEDQSE